MKEYFVIVSDTKGIYLADGCWSEENHGNGIEVACCWHKSMAVFLMKRMIHNQTDLHLHEVFPDKKYIGMFFASEDSCVAAGLKRWDAKAAKKGTT